MAERYGFDVAAMARALQQRQAGDPRFDPPPNAIQDGDPNGPANPNSAPLHPDR
ncbi:MAG: hypothetical protein O3C21_13630 [Verrucomicrobia bacterium]|nr:hypothetical protein [Verrucomicrobiota bacterium]